MATISNTPRPGYVWDSTDNCWYPIGVGNHNHSEIQKTLIDAKGDLIVGSAADTAARLAVGTDGYMLYADSTATNGVKWAAAPSSGGMTLLSTTTLSGATTTISTIDQSYKDLEIWYYGLNNASNYYPTIDPNGASVVAQIVTYSDNAGNFQNLVANTTGNTFRVDAPVATKANDTNNAWVVKIQNYASTTNYKTIQGGGNKYSSGSVYIQSWGSGIIQTNSAITSLVFTANGGSFTAGTVKIFGVN